MQRVLVISVVFLLAVPGITISASAIGGVSSERDGFPAIGPDDCTWQWDEVTSMPTPRYWIQSALLNDIIFVPGGRNATKLAVDTFEAYDVSQDSWTALAPLPVIRNGLGVATLDGFIHVVGGNVGASQYYTAHYRYDLVSNTWTQLASMNEPRTMPAVATIGGKIYVAGGANAAVSLTRVEIYDPGTDSWSDGPALPKATSFAASAVVGDKWYITGGSTPAVQVFDPSTSTWSVLPEEQNLPTPRNQLAGADLDGLLVTVGGFSGSTPVGTVEAFSPATGGWEPRPSLHTARSGLTVQSVGGSVYAIGGANPVATGKTEVLRCVNIVGIDVDPGSSDNFVNVMDKGPIPVAILSSADFDATYEVLRTTLTFGHSGYEQSLYGCVKQGRDANGDGFTDLICNFIQSKTGLWSGDKKAVLRGKTYAGFDFEGSDSVIVIASEKEIPAWVSITQNYTDQREPVNLVFTGVSLSDITLAFLLEGWVVAPPICQFDEYVLYGGSWRKQDIAFVADYPYAPFFPECAYIPGSTRNHVRLWELEPVGGRKSGLVIGSGHLDHTHLNFTHSVHDFESTEHAVAVDFRDVVCWRVREDSIALPNPVEDYIWENGGLIVRFNDAKATVLVRTTGGRSC